MFSKFSLSLTLLTLVLSFLSTPVTTVSATPVEPLSIHETLSRPLKPVPSVIPRPVARNLIRSDASIDSAGPDTDFRRNPTEGSNVPVTPKKVHSKPVRSYPVARGDKGPQKTKHFPMISRDVLEVRDDVPSESAVSSENGEVEPYN